MTRTYRISIATHPHRIVDMANIIMKAYPGLPRRDAEAMASPYGTLFNATDGAVWRLREVFGDRVTIEVATMFCLN